MKQFLENRKTLTALKILGLVIAIAIGVMRSIDQVSLKTRPAGGYDEQMWTGASITSYNMFFRGYRRTVTKVERWFEAYSKKYNNDIAKMPKEQLQWFDDPVWTFGWKAPNIGKYIMGFWVVNFGEDVNPEGYFYHSDNPETGKNFPGNFAPAELVRLARIPNAILNILTIAVVFVIGWLFFHYAIGLLASLYLVFNDAFFSVNTAAGLDSSSIFFSTLTLLFALFFLKSFG